MTEDDVIQDACKYLDERNPKWTPLERAALMGLLRGYREQQVQLATCTCYDGNPANYEGFHADCPIHGAIRAYAEASREIEKLRDLVARGRRLVLDLESWVECETEAEAQARRAFLDDSAKIVRGDG